MGYLSPEGMEEISRILGVAPSEVEAVASFYSMFFDRPGGRHHVLVCVNVSCALRGADDIVAHLERVTGLPLGGDQRRRGVHLGADGGVSRCLRGRSVDAGRPPLP